MKSHKYTAMAFGLFVIASLVLTACAPQATATPQVIVQTQIVEVEGTPQVQEVIVTATPMPEVEVSMNSADPTTYTWATFGDIDTLDPALDYETAGGTVLQNVYETLVWYNGADPNSFVPVLATEVPSKDNGGISEDGLTYTFNIRSGVMFHDGTEMTADDVAYAFQRGLLQGGTSSPQWLFTEALLAEGLHDVAELVGDGAFVDDPAGLAGADAAELMAACEMVTNAIVADAAAGTVTFNLVQPWAPFLATLANFWGSVYPKAWAIESGGWDGDCATWQNYYGKTAADINATPIGSTTNGTGPYMLDHWIPGEEYVLTANENYWRTEPGWEGGPSGPAAIKTVIVKLVDEFSTRYAMLQAGDADHVTLGSTADWPQMDTQVGEICDAQTLECAPSENPDLPLRLWNNFQVATRTDAFMTFNINTEGGNNLIGSGQLDGNGIPPDFFSNVHIRRAFAHCFDYETFIADVQQGEAVRSLNVMLPGMIGYDENTPAYDFDLDKCAEEFNLAAPELQELHGADINEVGFRFTIAYNTGNTQRQTVAQIFQTNLSLVNEKFVVEVTGLPWPNFLENQRASKLPIFVSGWIEDIHDPHNWVVPYTLGTYGLRQRMPEELRGQFAEIAGRAVAEPDPAARQTIYQEFNQLYYDEVPTVLLSVANSRRYEQRWVQGWAPVNANPISPGPYFYVISKQ
jgi:peptide/nickel transport system substrate-binding protein